MDDPSVLGSYGTQGVASSSNTPGNRFSMTFIYHPNSDSMIMTGGQAVYGGWNWESDLWQYSISLSKWIW